MEIEMNGIYKTAALNAPSGANYWSWQQGRVDPDTQTVLIRFYYAYIPPDSPVGDAIQIIVEANGG